MLTSLAEHYGFAIDTPFAELDPRPPAADPVRQR